MATKKSKIEKFLKENFEQSMYSGDLASNSKVKYVGACKYHIFTSSNGLHLNDIEGTFDEVMQKLNENVEIDKMMQS